MGWLGCIKKKSPVGDINSYASHFVQSNKHKRISLRFEKKKDDGTKSIFNNVMWFEKPTNIQLFPDQHESQVCE